MNYLKASEFHIGDKALCVDYMRMNAPRSKYVVVTYVGRSQVHCSTNQGVIYKFQKSRGVYSEHHLQHTTNGKIFLFKGKLEYDQYLEHIELTKWMQGVKVLNLSLDQLRRIKRIVEEDNK